MTQFLYTDITRAIIGASCEVWKVLGYGFLEKVYENALVEELRGKGLNVQPQVGLEVCYKGIIVGQYVADLLVENKVLIELKAEQDLNLKHQAQLLNYIKATGIQVGLLINFGHDKCEWKRLAM